jgi:hypothetical protein
MIGVLFAPFVKVLDVLVAFQLPRYFPGTSPVIGGHFGGDIGGLFLFHSSSLDISKTAHPNAVSRPIAHNTRSPTAAPMMPKENVDTNNACNIILGFII